MTVYKQKRRRPLPSPFLSRSGCHVKGRRWRPWFSRSKIAAPKEKRHPFGCLFSFVTAHMFCCLHSRPPQGRGSVRGEPLTGSPTRVQSPARRRPLLRSKSAAPKKKDTHVGVFLFCGCPQVLLFVRLAYRKAGNASIRKPQLGFFTRSAKGYACKVLILLH